ncbi:MAG: RpiB/LacA/LacB family sugar-phosphate isomerase, partial [Streptococcus dysgalactiae]|nr:RpiB/LacA/LacB family sugar-phosphate isomerase [Streptococcus dysgalactiae]
MAIILGADAQGKDLKEIIKEYLVEQGYSVTDVTDIEKDLVDNTLAVANAVKTNEDNLGIMIDA